MKNTEIKKSYESKIAEIEKLKKSIERQIEMSKTNLMRGNLLEKNKKMIELKQLIEEMRERNLKYWYEVYN